MRTSRFGTVLVVVTSASFNIVASAYHFPHWVGTIALAVMGTALVLLALQSPAITKRVPWELRRKAPEVDSAALHAILRGNLRRELQRHFGAFNALDKPTPAQLRSAAHSLAQTLEHAGYRQSAKSVEVHLQDDADQAAIDKRKNEVFFAVGRMLMWDEFQ